MAESIDAGIETHSMRTVLGMDDEGISTSDTYNIVVKDHGVKSGLKFDSVCITPVADVPYEDEPEKTLQVLYTRDKEQHGGLNYATVAIYDAADTPREVDESVTTSKIVRLRSSKKDSKADANGLEEGIYSSDADTLKSIRYGPTHENSEASEQQGIFASDPEALKYIRFGPQPQTFGETNDEEPEGIFASDPEALKFIKFGPKPATSAAANTDEPEGVFASDPESLKYIQFGRRPPTVVTASTKQKFAQFSDLSAQPGAAEAEGDVLAEATGLELKDNKAYSVRVTGHDLPDGQLKKFVSVRSVDGRGGQTSEEMDRMEVSVETSIGEDGMVEKFVVVE